MSKVESPSADSALKETATQYDPKHRPHAPAAETHGAASVQTEEMSEAESLRRMISFTKREAVRKDRTFCAYLLDLALNALDEDSEEMNSALRARITTSSMLTPATKPDLTD